MKKKNKIHFIFIALSILFLTTSIYLNINTTSYAKERIITEINNKPIVVEPAIEEIEEPETGEVVEEQQEFTVENYREIHDCRRSRTDAGGF